MNGAFRRPWVLGVVLQQPAVTLRLVKVSQQRGWLLGAIQREWAGAGGRGRSERRTSWRAGLGRLRWSSMDRGMGERSGALHAAAVQSGQAGTPSWLRLVVVEGKVSTWIRRGFTKLFLGSSSFATPVRLTHAVVACLSSLANHSARIEARSIFASPEHSQAHPPSQFSPSTRHSPSSSSHYTQRSRGLSSEEFTGTDCIHHAIYGFTWGIGQMVASLGQRDAQRLTDRIDERREPMGLIATVRSVLHLAYLIFKLCVHTEILPI